MSPGKTLTALSRVLGVSLESLRHWIVRAEVDEGSRPGLSTEERSELTKLRRENRTLREEREILKKAAAFFARDCIAGSVGRVGDAYDNAVAESFFATIKRELLRTRRFSTRAVASAAFFEWIEVFYNRQRHHTTIGGVSPC